MWGTELKQDVINSGATVVVRPDSGDPAIVVLECLKILDKYFGSVENEKGYKVLNNVRVLQGDGINHQTIRSIIFTITLAGYSIDNVAFGQGGALLQIVNRDDQKFAMKCSAALVNGKWVDVYKDPFHDAGKTSKKGRLRLIKTEDGLKTINDRNPLYDTAENMLQPVYENGKLLRDQSFDEIRALAAI